MVRQDQVVLIVLDSLNPEVYLLKSSNDFRFERLSLLTPFVGILIAAKVCNLRLLDAQLLRHLFYLNFKLILTLKIKTSVN